MEIHPRKVFIAICTAVSRFDVYRIQIAREQNLKTETYRNILIFLVSVTRTPNEINAMGVRACLHQRLMRDRYDTAGGI